MLAETEDNHYAAGEPVEATLLCVARSKIGLQL